MPKDNRQILRGIRINVAREGAKPDSKGVVHKTASLTYADGMEDELAAAFTQEQLDAMVKRGDLSGDWKAIKPVAEKPRSAGGKFSPAPPAP